MIALRAVAASFPDATPRRTTQDWTRITPFECQFRLKKIISIYFFTVKVYVICFIYAKTKYPWGWAPQSLKNPDEMNRVELLKSPDNPPKAAARS
jgi:hypothetical protein